MFEPGLIIASTQQAGAAAGGGGPALEPLVTIDFKNGVYEWGGDSHTLGETVEAHADYMGSSWNASNVVNGTGLRLVGTESTFFGGVLTSGAAADLLGGCVYVITYSWDIVDGDNHVLVGVDIGDLPDFTELWSFAGGSSGVSVVDNVGADAVLTHDVGTRHRSAVRVSAAQLAGSADGNAVEVAAEDPQDNASATHAGIMLGLLPATPGTNMTVIIEDIVGYALADIDNADLPGLSAL